MKRPPIRSRRDESDPHPWAELNLTDGSREVEVVELNGLLRARELAAERAGEKLDNAERRKLENSRRPTPTTHTFELDGDTDPTVDDDGNPTGPAPADEVHVLAQTFDGELEFVPLSKQRPEYYAHLAWFEPDTGEWTALEFHDPADR